MIVAFFPAARAVSERTNLGGFPRVLEAFADILKSSPPNMIQLDRSPLSEARRRYGQAIASMSTASFSSAPRLEMGGIGKSFGGVAVLVECRSDRSARRGGRAARLRTAQAKSTLVKILTGVYGRDAGTVAHRRRGCPLQADRARRRSRPASACCRRRYRSCPT